MKFHQHAMLATVLIILQISTTSPGYSKDNTADFPLIGIVTASKLVCRKEPNANSEQIKKFNFSNPVILINKSKNIQKINNIEGYWYQEKSTGGWLFGGYLLLTRHDKSTFKKFAAERIWCNVICGGFSCFYQFEPYLIGDYYISYVALGDYPQKNDPFVGIIIGKYSHSGNRLTFDDPFRLGGYYQNGEWINDYEKGALLNYINFKMEFEKNSDPEGEFYVKAGKNEQINRKAMRNKCGDKSNKEEIWLSVYKLTDIQLSEYNKIIPLDKFMVK